MIIMIKYSILWILITILFIKQIYTLRILDIHLPSIAIYGEPAHLNCTYDLENDHLYSIQWYKIVNGKTEEFYRFIPEQTPSVTTYDLPGIYIDVYQSQTGNVYLNKTDLNTEGVYRCEVSADSPSFQTVRKEAEIRVFQLPQIGPIIKQLPVIDNQVTKNHQLFTCTAFNSKPFTELSWWISGYPLNKFEEHGAKIIESNFSNDIDLIKKEYQLEQNKLFNSTSQLFLDVNSVLKRWQYLATENSNLANKNFFSQNVPNQKSKNIFDQLIITCKGKITHYLEQITEMRIVDTGTDHLITVKDSNEYGPILSGVQHQYLRSDNLRLNCTSTKSKSASDIIWLINDRPALENKNTLVRHFRPIQLTETEVIWRSSLSVPIDNLNFISSNLNSQRRFSGLKSDRKQLKIKCKSIKDINIDVGNAVYVIDLIQLNSIENANELNKQFLPARHNRSANIIWPIFTGEIVIGLFIVSMVICVIRSMCVNNN